MEEKKLPEYEAPKMLTYTDEEIFEMLGPAHTVISGVTGGNHV
ncbi:MAG: hypothetical protein HBSAPP01_21250 [Candidatus Brocadia sapporoensis]|nr:MAG: hypothetical protein HBSAPP01_21250 [Candidatus Brocadia sapporoensis]